MLSDLVFNIQADVNIEDLFSFTGNNQLSVNLTRRVEKKNTRNPLDNSCIFRTNIQYILKNLLVYSSEYSHESI